MKTADSLDVAAPGDLKFKSCDSASRLRLHIQKTIKNDRCGTVRLSKIAHIRTFTAAMPGPIKRRGFSVGDEDSFANGRPEERQAVLGLERQPSRIPVRNRSRPCMCGV